MCVNVFLLLFYDHSLDKKHAVEEKDVARSSSMEMERGSKQSQHVPAHSIQRTRIVLCSLLLTKQLHTVTCMHMLYSALTH